jgi:hypothetical protein
VFLFRVSSLSYVAFSVLFVLISFTIHAPSVALTCGLCNWNFPRLEVASRFGHDDLQNVEKRTG